MLASELTLDKFIDADVLAKAPGLPPVSGPIKTVLLAGATGFLGRFQSLAWLERLAETGGKLILIARGADTAQAYACVEAALESDTQLLEHFRKLAKKHVEVLPGDLGLPRLGLRIGAAAVGFDISHVSAELIGKYVADLRHLGLL